MKRWIVALAGTALWLALAAVAFAWPEAWQPGDKTFTSEHRAFSDGQVTVDVEVREYDDGARTILVNGRPFSVDPHPEDVCAPYWADYGMLSLDAPHREIPPAGWRAPDWRIMPSQHPLCKEVRA